MTSVVIAFLILLLNIKSGMIWSDDLADLASIKANDIARGGEFQHSKDLKYVELLGRTTGDLETLFDGFMQSNMHRYYLLSNRNRIGIANASNKEWRHIIVIYLDW